MCGTTGIYRCTFTSIDKLCVCDLYRDVSVTSLLNMSGNTSQILTCSVTVYLTPCLSLLLQLLASDKLLWHLNQFSLASSCQFAHTVMQFCSARWQAQHFVHLELLLLGRCHAWTLWRVLLRDRCSTSEKSWPGRALLLSSHLHVCRSRSSHLSSTPAAATSSQDWQNSSHLTKLNSPN